MLNSIFGRLRSSSTVENSRFYRDLDPTADEEEDGFLLIGSTQSDKTRITHQEFLNRKNQTNAPPSYDVVTENNTTAAMPGVPSSNVGTLGQQNQFLTPLTGVPFEIAPHLTLHRRLENFNAGYALVNSSFDGSKYDYDFHLERSYLKEMGTSEETLANSKYPSVQQSVQIHTNGDLIKF